jgi:hypothetical protein
MLIISYLLKSSMIKNFHSIFDLFYQSTKKSNQLIYEKGVSGSRVKFFILIFIILY